MDLTERTVSSQTIFEGHIVKLTVDQVRLPDGNLAGREVVHHPGGVAVLALDEENNVFLVRQYRYPIRQLLLELPAGKLDHGAEEDRLLGAKRELSEETGLEAEEFTSEQPSQQEEISLTVSLNNENFPQVQIQLYRYDGSSCLAVVDGEPVSLVLRSDAVDLMEAVRAIVLN